MHIHINSCFFQRIFCNIIIKVFDDTVELSAVRKDHHFRFREFGDDCKLFRLKFFIKLACRLIDQLH